MKNTPTVSVIIPTHNRPELLRRAIESVLAQSYDDFEVIVVSDSPSDTEAGKKTKEMIERFSDERVRFLQHEKQSGGAVARNTGIQNAQGELIAFLDDDDEWLPEKLAVQVPALEQSPDDVGFSFHAAIEVFDTGEHTTTIPDGVGDYYELALRRFSSFITSSLMVRKRTFDDVGVFDELFPSHMEIELIIRITKAGYRGCAINQPLVCRLALSSHEQIGSSYKNRIKGRIMLLERYAEDFAAHPAFKAKHIERLGKFYRHEKEWKNARREFMRALRLDFKVSRLFHWLSMFAGGAGYRIFRFIKGKR